MTATQKLKNALARLSDTDIEAVDRLCFMHLKEACKDFGYQGSVALKLLDLAEELLK